MHCTHYCIGAIQLLRNGFFPGNLTLPHNANNVEPYTFVTLICTDPYTRMVLSNTSIITNCFIETLTCNAFIENV